MGRCGRRTPWPTPSPRSSRPWTKTSAKARASTAMAQRTMRRLAKHEGYGNVLFEEVPVPSIAANQVLVKTHTSLISRGSEILARYRKDGPVDPAIMGYSVAGTIAEVGAD